MVKIFTYNSTDMEKTAYMNWQTSRHDHINNLMVIADGYAKASLKLVENLLIDNHDYQADILIFPILFNMNHAIEVYLKAINWAQNVLLGSSKEKFKDGHKINEILNHVIKLETDLEGKQSAEKLKNSDLKELREYIKELYNKIERPNYNEKTFKEGLTPDITFCRYPLDISQKHVQFYIASANNEVVDLEAFYNTFTIITQKLKYVIEGYITKIDYRNEMLLEERNW